MHGKGIRLQPLLTREALAHLTEDRDVHLLSDHLAAVGELARKFGEKFQAGEIARLAGVTHDLGKYSAAFQNRIRLANGFDAHIEGKTGGKPDHSTAGAKLIMEKIRLEGLPIALAIAGHHGGLRSPQKLKDRLQSKQECIAAALAGNPPPELLTPSSIVLPEHVKSTGPRLEFFTRMLYSALCDADFLDTEAFYDKQRAALRMRSTDLANLQKDLRFSLEEKQAKAPPTEVNKIRREVLSACRKAAAISPGFFSLTVPTGGGKTLSSLAFALDHALNHDLDRVIVAIPFTSITDQTAKAFRDTVGKDCVLEHHSLLKDDVDTPWNRIASENWDAPLVVTTTVQLFESLFANSTSACRKLHRIAKSVIILDEAQTLTVGLLSPILDVLSTLVADYGCSVVICTATQPAFARSPAMPEGFEEIREIIPSGLNLFERLKRVEVRWPNLVDGPLSYTSLADEIAGEEDVLAIVHRRKDARDLCLQVDEIIGDQDTFHLSALMCAAHRSEVFQEIHRRKSEGKCIRLISTQLVEAGVDLDFKIVYRALAGIDSLAQAAGRCNREGLLPGMGEMRVFLAPTKPPKGTPEQAMAIAQGFLQANPELDLFSPELYRRYFSQLYEFSDRDKHDIQQLRSKLDFKAVAEQFKMIEDDWSASLIVPLPEAMERVEELKKYGLSRERLRDLQKYAVTVPRRNLEIWRKQGCVKLIAEAVDVLDPLWATAYDPRFGLVFDRMGIADPALLIS